MKKKKNQIKMNKWLEMKPYKRESIIDFKYLRLCNTVLEAIESINTFEFLREYLDDEEIQSLACFLTSYFEDKVSGTNIFNSFIDANIELYNAPLPFCEVSNTAPPEDASVTECLEDAPNKLEVSFLIWYFTALVNQRGFTDPRNEIILDIAEVVAQVFDEAFEFGFKANIQLKEAYEIDEDEDDYYKARYLMQKVIFGSYLFYPDTGIRRNKVGMEIIEKNKHTPNVETMLDDFIDSASHSWRTKLLSLSAKEWTSRILGKEHKLSNDILNMSDKVKGFFLYEKQDENDVFIEHIASGKKFKLTKKSFDYAYELNKNSIFYLGLVNWKGEWWFSGSYVSFPFKQKIIDMEKMNEESLRSVSFLNDNKDKIKDYLKNQLQVFQDISEGEQINFMPTKDIKNFMKKFHKRYNESLNLSKDESKQAEKRSKEKGIDKNNFKDVDFPESEFGDKALVFFNPNSGIEFEFDSINAFPLKNNCFFNEERSDQEAINLLLSPYSSKELILYCIENCKEKLSIFDTEMGKLVLDNLDFLLRFWKAENYHTKAQLILV